MSTKVVTIPRLELTAAVISAAERSNTKRRIKSQKWQEVYFFGQILKSKLVTSTMKTQRFQVLVANQVQRIQEPTDPRQWYYMDTAEKNPADHASRSMKVTELINSYWFKEIKEQETRATSGRQYRCWKLKLGGRLISRGYCHSSQNGPQQWMLLLEFNS